MRIKAGFGESHCRRCMKGIGSFVADYPVAVITASVSLSVAMAVVGYFTFKFDSDFLSLALTMNSRAMKELKEVESYFPPNSRYFNAYRFTKYFSMSMAVIKAKDGGPVTRKEVLAEIKQLNKNVTNMIVSYGQSNLTYKDLCGWTRRGECFTSNINSINDNTMYPVTFDRNGKLVNLAIYFSKPPNCTRKICKLKGSLHARLTYFATTNDQVSSEVTDLWKKQFVQLCRQNFQHIEVRTAEEYEFNQAIIDLSILVLGKLPIAACIVIIFAIISIWNKHFMQWKPWIFLIGLLCLGLALVTTHGLLLLLGVPIVPTNVAALGLLLGVGLDDVFVMLYVWNTGTSNTDTLKKRARKTYARAGVAITITSLTNAICLYMAYTIPVESFKIFSIYAGTGILAIYLYQITFFGAALVIIGRWENKHIPLPNDLTKVNEKSETKVHMHGNIMQQIFTLLMTKLLTSRFSPWVILSLYSIYVVMAYRGLNQLDVGFRFQDVMQSGSNISQFFEWNDKHFRDYPYTITVIFKGDIDYSDGETQANITNLIKTIVNSDYGTKNDQMVLFWLNNYKKYLSGMSRRYGEHVDYDDFVRILKEDYLPGTEFYPDVIFSKDGQRIIASRSFIAIGNVSNTEQDQKMMITLRKTADTNGQFNVTVYNPLFIFFDHFLDVIPTTLNCCTISTAIMFGICLLFISNLTSAFWVAFTILSVEFGVIGFMSFLDLRLEAVSSFGLIISIGFSVDYGAHVSYAFATVQQQGVKGIDNQIKATIDHIGWPIMQGAVSTIIGVTPLYIAKTYIFRANVTIIVLVILFGLLHGLFIIPTLLRLVAKFCEWKSARCTKQPTIEVDAHMTNGPEASVKFLT